MIAYLCDGCGKPLPPDKVRPEDAKPGQRIFCDECSQKSQRDFDAVSCKDCQVAVWRDGAAGGGVFDLDNNVFCSSCSQNPTKRFSPKKFRCNRCGDVISIEDLKAGRAVAVEEKAYCSTCKRKAPDSQRPAAAPPDAPARAKPPAPAAARIDESDPEKSTTATQAAMKSPTRGTGEVRCDLCNKSFRLSDLRSGSAQIKDGKVLCPRCLSRLSKRAGSYDSKFVLSLVFIIIVFPLVSAALIVVGFILVNSSRGTGREDGKGQPDTGSASQPEPRLPGVGPVQPVTDPRDSAGSTPSSAGAVNLSKDDITAILKALKDDGAKPPPGSAPGPRIRTPQPAPKSGDEGAARPVEALLNHADPAQRMEGVLRAAASADARAQIPKLVERLGDTDPFVRAFAAQALGRMKAAEAGQPLLRLIRDSDRQVRYAAARALVQVMDIRFKHADDFSADELDNFIKYLEWLKKKKKEDG